MSAPVVENGGLDVSIRDSGRSAIHCSKGRALKRLHSMHGWTTDFTARTRPGIQKRERTSFAVWRIVAWSKRSWISRMISRLTWFFAGRRIGHLWSKSSGAPLRRPLIRKSPSKRSTLNLARGCLLGDGLENVRIRVELNRSKDAKLGRPEFIDRERTSDVGHRVRR